MGAMITLTIASTFSFGRADLQPPVPVTGPTVRVTEGVFMSGDHESRVHYFDAGAAVPPHMEKIAVLTHSGVAGRVVRTMRGAEYELRIIAERPDSFDIYVPEFEGEAVENVVGVIDDEDGIPMGFVTSERENVVGLVVDVEESGLEIVEQEVGSSMPMTVGPEEHVIGIVTINPRGGFNALVDHLNPHEAQVLLEMYEFPQDGQPGQN